MIDLIDKGGLISWILIGLSIITVAIIIFKFLHFWSIRLNNTKSVRKSLIDIANDRPDIAVNTLKKSSNPIAKTTLYAITKIEEDGSDNAQDSIKEQGNITLAHLRRMLPWLDTIAHVAPLLGLLGTVVGMIKSFRQLEAAGVQVDVTMLAGGIWEALLTTAIGLIISMVALIAVNTFEAQLEKARMTMSIAISKLLELSR